MNNRTLMQEMLHCTDMAVLERQRARFKWQEQQQQRQIQLVHEQQQQQLGLLDSCFGDFNGVFQLHHQQQQLGFQGGLGELLTTTQLSSVKPDPNLVDNNMWNDVAGYGPNCGFGDNSIGGSGFEMNFAISRTSSCPPAVAAAATVAAAAAVVKSRQSDVSDKISCGVGRDSFQKRKHDKVQTNPEVVAEEDSRNKKIKICVDEGEPKITEKNNNNKSCSSSSNNNNNNNKGTNNIKENSPETSKDNSKVTEVQKLDYIHVRARRGQATDSHSLAERVRREKISERMKYLQDLVPGCNKITGKAGMLDEIINYVQSLQRQVEFLSMKLATVNPRLDFNIDNSFAKEAFPACAPNFSTIGMSSEMTNPAYLQFNPEQYQQKLVSCGGLDLGINPPDMELRRTISAPIPVPETTFDSSCFNQIQPSPAWDHDLQNLYNLAFDQARSTTNSFASHQPFTGSVEAGNMKMEM